MYLRHNWQRRFSPIPVCVLSAILTLAPSLSGQTPEGQEQAEVMHGVKISWPAPWKLANRTRNSVEIATPLPTTPQGIKPGEKPTAKDVVAAAAAMRVEVEPRRSHQEALNRLAEIAAEYPEHPELRVIAGWPALERVRKAPLPSPGEAQGTGEELATFVTTVVAADSDVVRFETTIAPGYESKAADALEIARKMTAKLGNAAAAQQELGVLSKRIVKPTISPEKSAPPKPQPKRPPSPGAASGAQPGIGRVQTGVGELEVAMSSDGKHVVVAANSGFSFSDDGGQTFTFGGGTPCIFHGCDGDPSLSVGKSGNFYYSWIGIPNNEPNGIPPNGFTDSLSMSTDNGHTFSFRSNAVVCPSTTTNICWIPDQEHIAADRTNFSGAGKDQVYLVWRNFSSVGLTPRIVCSNDGASTWSTPALINAAGDLPRINVGGDGFVYVVYRSGANIMVNKYSSCSNGLVQQMGFPLAVTSVTDVVCPVPGLDRCNNGNVLSSQMVAVDDKNPNYVLVAYATNTAVAPMALGNENVMVRKSLDGGSTWSAAIQINSAPSGRRFMPWICSTSGAALVSWYDRRAATNANNDLTDYFARLGALKGGAFQLGPEIDVSNNPDPECASGFPCGARSPGDFNTCSVPTPGSNGSGCPKYGDYNGNACAGGNIVVAWASATSPQGVAPGTGLRVFGSNFSVAAISPHPEIFLDASNEVPGRPPRTLVSVSGQNFTPGGLVQIRMTLGPPGGTKPQVAGGFVRADQDGFFNWGSMRRRFGCGVDLAAVATDLASGTKSNIAEAEVVCP